MIPVEVLSFAWNNRVVVSLWEEWTTLSVDADLVYCYQLGLAFGFVLLTTFCLFSTPSTISDMGDKLKKKENRPLNHLQSIRSSDDSSLRQGGRKQGTNTLHQQPPAPDAHSAATDTNASNNQSTTGASPHQQLNCIIYVIIISVILVILDREYNGGIRFWLAQYFPREAALLRGQ
jgi:hypothetical protein